MVFAPGPCVPVYKLGQLTVANDTSASMLLCVYVCVYTWRMPGWGKCSAVLPEYTAQHKAKEFYFPQLQYKPQ